MIIFSRATGSAPGPRASSEKTIRITTTVLTALKDFLEARQYPADVTEIGASELR